MIQTQLENYNLDATWVLLEDYLDATFAPLAHHLVTVDVLLLRHYLTTEDCSSASSRLLRSYFDATWTAAVFNRQFKS